MNSISILLLVVAAIFVADNCVVGGGGDDSNNYIVGCVTKSETCKDGEPYTGKWEDLTCALASHGCVTINCTYSEYAWTDLTNVYEAVWTSNDNCSGPPDQEYSAPCGVCVDNEYIYCNKVSSRWADQVWDNHPPTPEEKHGVSNDFYSEYWVDLPINESTLVYDGFNFYNIPDQLGVFYAYELTEWLDVPGGAVVKSLKSYEEATATIGYIGQTSGLIDRDCTNATTESKRLNKLSSGNPPFSADAEAWQEYYENCNCVKKIDGDSEGWLYYYRSGTKGFPASFMRGGFDSNAATGAFILAEEEGSKYWFGYVYPDEWTTYAAMDAYHKYGVQPYDVEDLEIAYVYERLSPEAKDFKDIQKFYISTTPNSYFGKYCGVKRSSVQQTEAEEAEEDAALAGVQDTFDGMHARMNAQLANLPVRNRNVNSGLTSQMQARIAAMQAGVQQKMAEMMEDEE